jgi:glycerate 2-kinase
VKSDNKKDDALQIFRAAVDAVHPSHIIPGVLRLNDDKLQVGELVFPFSHFQSIYVAGAGKAAAAMAYEVEKILKHHIQEGVVAVRDVPDFPLKYVRTIVSGHPLPDHNSVVAGEEITKLVRNLTKNDLFIFLLSGGASSLMMDVPYECTLQEVNVVLDQLLKSGATIQEMNTVRKHLSELKGGQLVKKCSGATIISLIISDVPGNDLSVIGSGPTVGDESMYKDAMQVLEKYGLKKDAPFSIVSHLQKGIEGTIDANPKPGDKIFANTTNTIIADNKKALDAAMKKAAELGYEAHVITDSLNGPVEETAMEWCKKAISLRRKNICMLGGGETTVHVKGSGKGGRNQQFALTAAIALQNSSEITLLAAGTDGSDGPTDAAGAVVDSETYNAEAEKHLHNNDAYSFFEKYGGLIKTGATHTNVMDIVVTLIS